MTDSLNGSPESAAPPTSIRVVGMRKEYPGTLAVDFDPGQELAFLAGEIHAVVGENGAGKSTLLSMIAGVTPTTEVDVEIVQVDVVDRPAAPAAP